MDSGRRTLAIPMPLVLAMLAVGLGWLALSAHQGLTNGHESDIHRRWKMFRYALAGVNPYPLSSAALEKKFGRFEDFQQTGIELFAIPRLTPEETSDPAVRAMLERYGTPEATYPPSADLLMGFIFGWVPESAIHLTGVVVNIVLLGVIILLLTAGSAPGRTVGFVAAAALMLLWSPAQTTIVTGQASLIVLACVLLAVRLMADRPVVAGLLFAIALAKPTLSLPFLLLPLVRRRCTTLAVACGIHVAFLLVQSVRFGAAPWDLLSQWLDVGRYFTHCMYTLQEALNRARLDHTALGWGIVFGFVVTAAGWCWVCRRADDETIFDSLCLVSLLWTQHLAYDFVLLFVPLLRVMSRGRTGWRVVAVVSFVLFSLGLSTWVYGDEQLLICRLARALTRVLLVAWLIGLALRLRRASLVDAEAPVRRVVAAPGPVPA